MPPEGQYDSIIKAFATEGIARSRLDFHSRRSRQAYMALHDEVDICLDAFPYTGGTTTAIALWMGVPTLTLAGDTPPSRQGNMIMNHVGLDAFVASDPEDFERKGIAWATRLPELAELRATLRQRYEDSPLLRPDVIAAGLESALRTMWKRWCAGLPAEASKYANR